MAKLTTLNRSVKGLTVLVTGAASGMGRATAYLFADEGANVAAVDVNEKGLQETMNAIKASGASGEAWTLDLTDKEAIKRVVGEVADTFGGIDILVNNAGISYHTKIDDDEYEEKWAKTVAVLLTAHTLTIRAALPHLRESASPRIINIASTEGMGATPETSPYTACKHGVIGLTRSLAVELGKEGITVNCICPGPITTAMTAQIPDENKAIYARRRTALRRYGDPEEVAHGTLNFALPASSFMTGATLQVDGGLTIRRA